MNLQRTFKISVLIVLFSLSFLKIFSQTAIGEWKSYLPYSHATTLADAGDKIFCGTESGLFALYVEDESYEIYTKVNGLSDNGISKIRYHQGLNILVIAYDNTNIDLLENKTVVNVPDILKKSVPGEKIIYNIDIRGNYAYFSCSFGIVVLDLVKKEFKDTYYIGEQGEHIPVYDIDFYKEKILAATNQGVFYADMNSEYLANFEMWKRDTLLIKPLSKYNCIASVGDVIFAGQKNDGWVKDTLFVFNGIKWDYYDKNQAESFYSIDAVNEKILLAGNGYVNIYNKDLTIWRKIFNLFPGSPDSRQVTMRKDSSVWFADINRGLVKNWDNYWTLKYYHPNGPSNNYSYNLNYSNDNLWVATGGRNTAYNGIWMKEGIFQYCNNTWNKFALDTILDVIAVIPHPTESGRAYACSLGNGVFEVRNGKIENVYNINNSSLENIKGYAGYFWVGVGGGTFDDNGNLWLTNSFVNTALNVLKADGTWRALDCTGYVPDNYIGGIAIDKVGQKWMNYLSGGGILVYNDNGTIDNNADDKKIVLKTGAGSGNLPSGFVNCISRDKDGLMWIGTNNGMTVFQNPENIFSGNSIDAQQILVLLDGYYQPLFQYKNITSIAIDGANRKWVSTSSAGAFLMNPDCTEEILHFTKDNSPLISDNVLSITIDPKTGEVFFGCEGGIVSYKGNATEGNETFESVKVWPNPVKESYTGPIAISGLISNSEVHIADISGHIVSSIISIGGQAIWYGEDFQGNRVQSGVYSVFCSDSEGKQTYVAKIMVIN